MGAKVVSHTWKLAPLHPVRSPRQQFMQHLKDEELRGENGKKKTTEVLLMEQNKPLNRYQKLLGVGYNIIKRVNICEVLRRLPGMFK